MKNQIEEIDLTSKSSESKNLIPRRYGKEQTLKDIENQGTKATPLQLAMLKLNDLKNLNVRINKICINDVFSEDKKLSHQDCNGIIETIEMFEQKLNTIIDRQQ